MKFWEIMRAFDEGKKVRCKDWKPNHFISRIRWFKYEINIEEIVSDWELYEEPVQLLSFTDVVKGLNKRKKFRRKVWEFDSFITQRGGAIVNEANDIGNFLLLEDYEATDWVEVK